MAEIPDRPQVAAFRASVEALNRAIRDAIAMLDKLILLTNPETRAWDEEMDNWYPNIEWPDA